MLPLPELGHTVFVCGPVSSGKTFLLKQWANQHDRVIIFDPTAEYKARDHWDTEIWYGPKAAAMAVADNEQTGNRYRVIYHPLDSLEGFKWLAQAAWQSQLPRIFICEECHEIMSPNFMAPEMKMISKYSRKRLLTFVGSSQRYADVHPDFRSAVRLTVLFYTNEPRDLLAIEQRFGEEGRQKVQALRPLIYDEKTKQTRQTPQVLRVTRDSGALEVFDL